MHDAVEVAPPLMAHCGAGIQSCIQGLQDNILVMRNWSM
jgi:hypothetical protein